MLTNTHWIFTYICHLNFGVCEKEETCCMNNHPFQKEERAVLSRNVHVTDATHYAIIAIFPFYLFTYHWAQSGITGSKCQEVSCIWCLTASSHAMLLKLVQSILHNGG